jgi:hypothetical protein
MPFVFIIIGIVLLVSGARGSSSDLLTLVKGDLTGSNNFGYWILSILVIGALGYIDDLRTVSRGFLVLVIIVLLLNEDKQSGTGGGFFSQFQAAFGKVG